MSSTVWSIILPLRLNANTPEPSSRGCTPSAGGDRTERIPPGTSSGSRARVNGSSSIAAMVLLLNVMSGRTSAGQAMNTGDPVKRGLTERDFPRARQLTPGVYSYEALRAGDPGGKMTTVSLIVVTSDGVLVADGQGNVEQTKEMVDWIAKTTTQPIKYVVICSDHGDHTGGNAAFPSGVTYLATPASVLALAAGHRRRLIPCRTNACCTWGRPI